MLRTNTLGTYAGICWNMTKYFNFETFVLISDVKSIHFKIETTRLLSHDIAVCSKSFSF